MSDLALLPCPFCGVAVLAAYYDGDADDYTVQCRTFEGGCGAQGPYAATKDAAASRWNYRAVPHSVETPQK